MKWVSEYFILLLVAVVSQLYKQCLTSIYLYFYAIIDHVIDYGNSMKSVWKLSRLIGPALLVGIHYSELNHPHYTLLPFARLSANFPSSSPFLSPTIPTVCLSSTTDQTTFVDQQSPNLSSINKSHNSDSGDSNDSSEIMADTSKVYNNCV
jgi:hypothetical protein